MSYRKHISHSWWLEDNPRSMQDVLAWARRTPKVTAPIHKSPLSACVAVFVTILKATRQI